MQNVLLIIPVSNDVSVLMTSQSKYNDNEIFTCRKKKKKHKTNATEFPIMHQLKSSKFDLKGTL